MKLFRKKRNDEQIEIVVSQGAKGNGVEGYNRLRDNILYLNADGNHKVIQIESSSAREGKTTVACNLAASLGLTEKKICVLDLDFRRPRVHRVFNISKDEGLAEYFLGHLTKEQIIKQTEHSNVDVITRGGEIYNSSLVLLSDKFKELIAFLREKYDYVIVDCPPVLQVSDYIHISKVTDGVIFVIAYGITTKNQVAEAVKELRNNDANILGTVLSMYNRKDGGYYYYY